MQRSIEVDKLLHGQQRRDQSIVLDGAVELDRYLIAAPRILWILREPHGAGPWDLRKFFRERLFWKATAGLLIKVSHGLLNGCKPWSDWANDPRSIADCLRDVAIINVNKRGGDSRVNWKRLHLARLEFGEIICQQVAALAPQIVILGGTWSILPDRLKTKLSDLDSSDSNCACVGGTIYVRAYHPNQTKITHKAYYNCIRDCAAKICAPSSPKDA